MLQRLRADISDFLIIIQLWPAPLRRGECRIATEEVCWLLKNPLPSQSKYSQGALEQGTEPWVFLWICLAVDSQALWAAPRCKYKTCLVNIHKINTKKDFYVKRNNTFLCASSVLLFWHYPSTARPCRPSSGSQTNAGPLIDHVAQGSVFRTSKSYTHTQLSSSAA